MSKLESKYWGICVVLAWLTGGAFAHSDDLALYVSDGASAWAQWDIYARDLDTGSVTQLTDHAAIDNHPELSPDGKWVVWSSTRGNGEFDLYLGDFTNLEATARRLTDDSYPNGSQTTYPDRHPHFHTLDPHIILFTTKNRPLAYPVSVISECSSPKIIVPPRFYEGLNVIRVDTNGVPTDYVELDIRDAWNPTTHPDIWTTNTSTYVGHPTFSYSGDQLLFTASIDGEGKVWEVYTCGFDTNTLALAPDSLRRRTFGPAVGPNPIQMSGGAHFSRDDSDILFSSTRTSAGNSHIFSIPSTGEDVAVTNATQLTDHPGNDYIPEPRADGGFLCVSDLGEPGMCGETNGPTFDLDLALVDGGGVRTNLTDNDANNETSLLADEVSWFCGLPPNLTACGSIPRIMSIESLWLEWRAWQHVFGMAPDPLIPADLLHAFGYPDQAVRMYAEGWLRMSERMSIRHSQWPQILNWLQQMDEAMSLFPGLEDEILLREWLASTESIRHQKFVVETSMHDRGLGAEWTPWESRWMQPPVPESTFDFDTPDNWDRGVPGAGDVARFDGRLLGHSVDTIVVRLPSTPSGNLSLAEIDVELIQLELQGGAPLTVGLSEGLRVRGELSAPPTIATVRGGVTIEAPMLRVTNNAELRAVDSFFDIAYEIALDGGALTTLNSRVTADTLSASGSSIYAVDSFFDVFTEIRFSGGPFEFHGSEINITNSVGEGVLDISGALRLNSSTVVVDRLMLSTSGVLRGDGLVTMAFSAHEFEANGEMAPGNSPGILTIDGNLSMSTTTTLRIELGGTAVGTEYDRLVVTGLADIDGTLSIVLTNGFVPSAGDAFDVLTYGSHSNEFAVRDLPPLAPDLLWHTTYGVTSVTLHVLARSGDVDSDGIPNGWELDHFGGVTNANPAAMASNGVNTLLEAYIADLDPHDPASVFAVADVAPPSLTLTLDPTSTGRVYDVEWSTSLLQTPILWNPYGFDLSGTGSNLLIFITNDVPFRVYRLRVRLP